MVNHEIVIRFRRDASDKAIDRVIYLTKRLSVNLEGVQEIAFNRNRAEGYGGAMMVVTLADENALDHFLDHPVYKTMMRVLATITENMASDRIAL